MRLFRLIRYRYPNTAKVALFVLASAAALFFGPSRKWGALGLGLLAVTFVSVAAEKRRERRP